MTEIQVLTFNVLAAPWADPDSYPAPSSIFLDRFYRRDKNIECIRSLLDTTDIIAFQETTLPEFGFFVNALPEFTGVQINHDPKYWSKYVSENPPWELNGVSLFLKKSSFGNIQFDSLKNSNSGNYAVYAEAIHLSSGKKLGVASIHLDSDVGGNRDKEMDSVINYINTRSNDLDIIAGDFNYVTDKGNFSKDLKRNGYIDVLQSLGNNDKTHPDLTGYTHSPNYFIIDHIVARGAQPLAGDVLDNNLWTLYPDDNDTRITENLRLTGSDHFPVWGKIRL